MHIGFNQNIDSTNAIKFHLLMRVLVPIAHPVKVFTASLELLIAWFVAWSADV